MKIGIELGIRASQKAILRAAEVAEKNGVDYFFVPETHPDVYGVDAFETLFVLSKQTKRMTLGTGIINVFSRSKEDILSASEKLYSKTDRRFVLGIGTSAPTIIEKLWKMKFERPLSRLKEYTKFFRDNFSGQIFWAAVGEKTVQESAINADGVLFFLKPKNQIKKDLVIIKQSKPDDKNFEVLSILPVYFSEDNSQAKITIASYLGANKFYSKPLVSAGFEDQVNEITSTYKDDGLKEAVKKVSDEMAEMLAVYGSAMECAKKISEIRKESHLDAIILGFDMPESGYTDNFFNELETLLKNIDTD